MKISVIFTTYNSPAWLEKVLWGFEMQTDSNFEVVIADDGSGEETRTLVERFKHGSKLNINHVWHPDAGFQKCRILNRAIMAADGDYIIMTDGDCIPRNDFVAVHRQNAQKGHFLSGGYFKLPMDTSEAITRENVESGACFNIDWLRENGVPKSFKLNKFSKNTFVTTLLNIFTPTKRTWNGHNASCFKEDMLKINGFDERMRYGGQDREFGERLMNMGLKGKQIRYKAVCIHLDHARGYANEKDWENNRNIRSETRTGHVISTPVGIQQMLAEEGAK